MPTLRIIEIEGTVDECLALGNAFIFQRSEERIGKEQKPEARDAPASGVPDEKPPDSEDQLSYKEAPVTQEPEKAQLIKEPQVKGLPKEEAPKKLSSCDTLGQSRKEPLQGFIHTKGPKSTDPTQVAAAADTIEQLAKEPEVESSTGEKETNTHMPKTSSSTVHLSPWYQLAVSSVSTVSVLN